MGFFDKDEEKKISTYFWSDGQSRRITAEKDWRPSKSDATRECCYIIAYDVDTKEERSFLDFNFLDALKKLPDGKYDNHILKVTPHKVGDRKYQDKTYDVFEFDIEATGEFAQPKDGVNTDAITF